LKMELKKFTLLFCVGCFQNESDHGVDDWALSFLLSWLNWILFLFSVCNQINAWESFQSGKIPARCFAV
jgi:hypothetical protein